MKGIWQFDWFSGWERPRPAVPLPIYKTAHAARYRLQAVVAALLSQYGNTSNAVEHALPQHFQVSMWLALVHNVDWAGAT
mmetsp:Transcript_23473/g.51530  ORF Transcript_23473/g.51530 Transcript_23473/m.51530 type:complete len:80 (+) Transcript_23473:755-994(+)